MTNKRTLSLTDGGLETTMVFHEGLELPYFASFHLLGSKEGRAALDRYFDRFVALSAELGTAYVLDTVTWRASVRWGALMGLPANEVDRINRDSVAYAQAVRLRNAHIGVPITINGVVGPQDDGYKPNAFLTIAQARSYHARQVRVLKDAGAEKVSAITMTYAEEAAGVALAAKEADVPCVISFTLETDGNLPSGSTLREAVEQVESASGAYPDYYMINCAHPDHFTAQLDRGAEWLGRIGGLRANASRMSHAELDVATALDDGDPEELAGLYRSLLALLPNLKVIGGCCGTDHRLVREIGEACCRNAIMAA